MKKTLIDVIIEWLHDHPIQAEDVVNYVEDNYPELTNELIFHEIY